VFDKATKVTGLFFAPAEAAAAPQPPPGREKAGTFAERAVSVGAAGWPLAGVLAVPMTKGPHPAVVLVHGSGPHDADETIGGTKVFRDLAQGLAARGVAALRYEKRSKAHGARMVAQPFTVKEEIVDDAVAAAAFLRTVPGIDPKRIFVLGHSLGGAMLPRIAKLDASLAGLISLAGSTKSIEDAVVQQTWYILEKAGVDADAKRKAMQEVDAFAQAVKDPDLAKRDPKQLLMGCPPAYWLDLRGYRPPDAAEKLPQRMLLLQGERDYQVKLTEDFAFWKARLGKRTDVTFKSYPALNHLFVPGEGDSVPAEYAKPGHVAAEVVEDIARWVR
jgi:dienelactone hydrolase